MQFSNWIPRNQPEGRLLKSYLEAVGGQAFMQVPVGENDPPGTRRVIDAVRIPGDSDREGGRWKFPEDENGRLEFWRRVSAASEVEVVEVKEQLGPYVIGQAYVGKLLLEDQLAAEIGNVNKATRVKPVVVCRGDPDRSPTDGLWQVCRVLNITVRKFPGKAKAEPRLYELELKGEANAPNRATIGQLVTARELLTAAHRNLRVNLTIECDERGNTSLFKVCEKLGIAVHFDQAVWARGSKSSK